MLPFLNHAAVIFLLLLFYSFLGWCGEMVYCSIGQRKLCEKRGFLNGPLCPIYGHGALLVLAVLGNRWNSPAATFLVGMVLTSAVEYVTSYVMEKLFHMRWWDYSRRRFNLNGRVCLLNSLLFGLACLVLRYGIQPRVFPPLEWLTDRHLLIPLALTLFVIYAADIVLSVRSAIQIGNRLEKLHSIQDELSEKLEALKAEQLQRQEAQRARLEFALSEARQAAAQRRAEAEQALSEARQAAAQRRAEAEQALSEARQVAAQRRAEAAQAIQDRLEPLGDEFAQRLEHARAEARQRLEALYAGQDIFERRLMRSFPTLRSPRHSEALRKLREYWENRKK